MISELERKIICSVIDGNQGITSITKSLFGDTVLKTDYERVKYHLRILEKEGLVIKNGTGYKMPEWAVVGDARIELQTDVGTEILETGKTMFIKGTAGENDATAVLFLEEKQSKQQKQ